MPDLKNVGLSPAQAQVFPTFDKCPKLCNGTPVGSKTYSELAELAIANGVNPDHCINGIEAEVEGDTQNVPCPYGAIRSGFVAAMATLVATREG